MKEVHTQNKIDKVPGIFEAFSLLFTPSVFSNMQDIFIKVTTLNLNKSGIS